MGLRRLRGRPEIAKQVRSIEYASAEIASLYLFF